MSAAIYTLVRVAGDLTAVVGELRTQLGPASLTTLPDPYHLFAIEAVDLIQSA